MLLSILVVVTKKMPSMLTKRPNGGAGRSAGSRTVGVYPTGGRMAMATVEGQVCYVDPVRPDSLDSRNCLRAYCFRVFILWSRMRRPKENLEGVGGLAALGTMTGRYTSYLQLG